MVDFILLQCYLGGDPAVPLCGLSRQEQVWAIAGNSRRRDSYFCGLRYVISLGLIFFVYLATLEMWKSCQLLFFLMRDFRFVVDFSLLWSYIGSPDSTLMSMVPVALIVD